MNASTPVLEPILARSQRLVKTKVFDAEYYAAETGRDFDSNQAAAIHFVQYGMKAGLSFHPLFDLGMFPVALRERYKAGDVEYLLTYLRSDEARDHAWSWLLDPTQLTGEDARGTLLLSKFRPEKQTPMVLPERFVGNAPAWLEARALIIGHARTVKSYELAKKPLRLNTWSDAAEVEWLASVQHLDAIPDDDSVVLSIVMPAWNREHAVRDAIDSVRNQTLRSWELIVVDDGSTDGTRDVVRAYAHIDSRIRLVEAEHLGVCAARNSGVAEASGKFLAFLDSDNSWRPDFLKNMYAGLVATGGRAGYAAIRMLNGRDEFLGQPVNETQLLIRNYVDLNVLVAETALVRELGGFDATLRRWVDYDLVLRIIAQTPIEYFPFIGCDYVDDDSDDRITRTESANWEHAVVGKNLERSLLPDTPGLPGEVPVLSVVMIVHENISLALRNIRKLYETFDESLLELVIIDVVPGFRNSVRLRSALVGLSTVRYFRMPRRYTDAISLNLGSIHATGPNIMFARDSIEFRADAIEQLLNRLQDPAVAAAQPLVTDPSGVVTSAGAAGQKNSLAVPLFRGLNIADAQRHNGRALDELSTSVFVVRKETFDRTGRFNHIFAGEAAIMDFFRRLKSMGEGELVAETSAVAIDHSADAGAEPAGISAADLAWLAASAVPSRTVESHYGDIGLDITGFTAPRQPKLQPAAPVLARRPIAQEPQAPLRWAIKICADFTAGGDRWGDVPYAADLAEALTAQGQEVVVDRAQAVTRPSNYLDDVVLVIRGLHSCAPQPGKTNILWAISRPDLITKEELLGFDVVFGASRIWCEYVRDEWGVPAQYLPQATNPKRFRPADVTGDEPLYELTFVGGPRKPIGRKIVADCIAAGRRVSVFGPRWEQFVPTDMVVADFVDNDELSAVYNSSRIVLNDHFEDMATWGFANNRLYDAVASGARVVSDEVDGIDEIFKGAVQTYTSVDELDEILRDLSVFPDDSEMAAISRMVREEHNFDKRAASLLDAARAHRGIRS